MELGGLDFLRGWGSEKVCIFIFCDTGENQILEVGREVDFFFLELLFEILKEKLPDEFGFRDP